MTDLRDVDRARSLACKWTLGNIAEPRVGMLDRIAADLAPEFDAVRREARDEALREAAWLALAHVEQYELGDQRYAVGLLERDLQKLATSPAQPDAADPLHPTGRCTCSGEGRCDWCRWRDAPPADGARRMPKPIADLCALLDEAYPGTRHAADVRLAFEAARDHLAGGAQPPSAPPRSAAVERADTVAYLSTVTSGTPDGWLVGSIARGLAKDIERGEHEGASLGKGGGDGHG